MLNESTLQDILWILIKRDSSWTFLEKRCTANDKFCNDSWDLTWCAKSARVLYARGRIPSLTVHPFPINTSSSNNCSMCGTNSTKYKILQAIIRFNFILSLALGTNNHFFNLQNNVVANLFGLYAEEIRFFMM